MKVLSLLGSSFPAVKKYPELEKVQVHPIEFKNDLSGQVLDVIYAPDPFTRLPQNDIAVYMSDKVDPQIKEFIATQLMSPNPDVKGIDDEHSDLLYDLIRQPDETQSDYAVRVREIIAADSDIRMKESELNKNPVVEPFKE